MGNIRQYIVAGSIWQALAAAVIGAAKNGTAKEILLMPLVEGYLRYFPDQRKPEHANSVECMRSFINTNKSGELVHKIAFVLHQITIDTLCANPEGI